MIRQQKRSIKMLKAARPIGGKINFCGGWGWQRVIYKSKTPVLELGKEGKRYDLSRTHVKET
jgi:hypothetical protein